MRLERFRVGNFRGVNDSGWIPISGTTAFVGRNESGKTNLLQALASLNDSVVPRVLSRMRDFPADRLHSDYSDALDVVRTSWLLSEEERESLAELLPEARSLTHVEVGRGYAPNRWVRFVGLSEPELPSERVLELIKHVDAATAEPGAAPDPGWVRGVTALTTAARRRCEDRRAWATEVGRALAGLQPPLQSGRMVLGDSARAALEEITEIAMQVATEPELENAAQEWVLRRMPRFLYLDQYPDIDGRQNLTEFAARQREGRPEPGDAYFAMLLRVSGIDLENIGDLIGDDPELRRQIASRAGAVLTKTLRRIWTDRPLKVRFNIDGDHFDTLVSDPTSLCDIEVNLNQRSRGFRWFFSFYVMFASGEKDGSTSQTLLLLDEPGLHLHALGQKDLLNHLSQDLGNQVVLATQSPFMLPEGDDSRVCHIDSGEETGTILREGGDPEFFAAFLSDPVEATDEHAAPPTPQAEIDGTDDGAASRGSDVTKAESDATSAEALEIAIGTHEAPGEIELEDALAPAFEIGEMLDGRPALLLEHITDYWYLLAASDYLDSQLRTSIPRELALTPIGGAAAVPFLRRQLGCGSGDALALSSVRYEESEEAARQTVWIGEAFESPTTDRVDVEDLLSPDLYDRFARFGYRDQLEGRHLDLDPSIPRIVERYQRAFAAIDIEFKRTRPARLILRGAFKNPEALMTQESADRFERLFEAILMRF